MAAPNRPRFGSLQFWPRKKADKIIPSVNWTTLKGITEPALLGFLTYKAAMATVSVKDNTPDSMTKGKKMVIPVTILEAPNMKIFSIRFHKDKQVVKEVLVSNDKELKRVVTIPKTLKNLDSEIPKEFDDVTVIAFSIVSQTAFKKTPDITELGVSGENAQKKLEYVKSLIGKEITIKDFLNKKELLDSRASTRGHGLTGPLPRFGLSLKAHKSEKGRRRPGSLGPWHPHHVIFRVPQAGQFGMFTRVAYNNKVIFYSDIKEKNINPKQGFKHYGNVKASYLLLKGSVQGPVKRQILLTASFRPSKDMLKKKYEFLEILR